MDVRLSQIEVEVVQGVLKNRISLVQCVLFRFIAIETFLHIFVCFLKILGKLWCLEMTYLAMVLDSLQIS